MPQVISVKEWDCMKEYCPKFWRGSKLSLALNEEKYERRSLSVTTGPKLYFGTTEQTAIQGHSTLPQMTKAKQLWSNKCRPQKLDQNGETCLQEVQQALRDDPSLKPKRAAQEFNVPYTTLLNRIRGVQPRKKAHEKEMLLNTAEQKVMVDWMHYLGFAGFPVCK